MSLTHECRDRGADVAAWQTHFLNELAAMVGADLILGGELDGLADGRPAVLNIHDWGWENGFDRAGWYRAQETLSQDPTYSVEMMAYAERFREEDGVALNSEELVPEKVLARCVSPELYRVTGIGRPAWCCRRVGPVPGRTFGSLVCRGSGERPFNAREKAIVSEAHAAIAPMVGNQLARHTEPAATDLPPQPRRVLECLLEGNSYKQVAARLGLSRYTVEQYVKTIYRHFNVSSHAELLAIWVRRGRGRNSSGSGNG